MDYRIAQAQTHQILALNEEMLKKGCISQEEHDFIRSLQMEKLTKLQAHATMVKG